MKIILFEDTEGADQQMIVALKKALGTRRHAILFKSSHKAPTDGTYDKQLEDELVNAGHSDASLIVADSDLSKLKQYSGLSEPVVRVVADRLGIPECNYARGRNEPQAFLADTELRETRVTVSLVGGYDLFAKNVVSIAEGFAQISKQLPKAQKAPGKNSPGKLLASILGKPEYSEKISLYAAGDQNRLASLLPLNDGSDIQRRVACMLGYWLWDSVLRFPGVVVNNVAASSYLNIHEKAFDNNVQSVFDLARYKGPFWKVKPPLWWRGVLDDLVSESGKVDGRTFAATKLKRKIAPSRCCEDPDKPAGYYCMLTGKPVSLDKSHGGLAWFPRGADLARISNRKYAEISPWL